jgi:hypothetical protein
MLRDCLVLTTICCVKLDQCCRSGERLASAAPERLHRVRLRPYATALNVPFLYADAESCRAAYGHEPPFRFAPMTVAQADSAVP